MASKLEPKPQPRKKLNLKLTGLNGNAFVLMAAFKKQALREGWEAEEITKILDQAMTGDYDYLLSTLASHCKNGGF